MGSVHLTEAAKAMLGRGSLRSARPVGTARKRGWPAIAAFVLAAAIGAPATIVAAGGRGTVLIRDALLIDGTGRGPRPATDIFVRHGRIARVGAAGSIKVPAGTLVVAAAGKTVIPGLINLRGLAGLILSPRVEGSDFGRTEIVRDLARYASYGVTTVATPGPSPRLLKAVRDDIDSKRLRGVARVLTPIRTLRATEPAAEPFPRLEDTYETAPSVVSARRSVDRLAREGADFVAYHESSCCAGEETGMEIPLAIIQRARRRGLAVAIRTSSVSAAAALVRAGAGIVAGSVCDREAGEAFVAAMLGAKAVYAPALFTEMISFRYGDRVEWLDDRYLRRSLTPGITGMLRGPASVRQALDPDRALKRHQFDIARRNLGRLAEAGVPIGFASGSGVPGTFEGYSEYREAVLMKRAGMSALSIIRAFSRGSATALGIDRERGPLLPGRLGDLVILNANPLENIHNLRELHGVLVGGQLVKL